MRRGDQVDKEIFLKKGFDQKVRRIIRHRLVERDGNGGFICKPLPRNHETHFIHRANGLLVCDCDGFKKQAKERLNPSCSHVQAVLQVFPQANQGVLFNQAEIGKGE
jgi:hypothetical protein